MTATAPVTFFYANEIILKDIKIDIFDSEQPCSCTAQTYNHLTEGVDTHRVNFTFSDLSDYLFAKLAIRPTVKIEVDAMDLKERDIKETIGLHIIDRKNLEAFVCDKLNAESQRFYEG